ncbi:hypothetical protein KC351_g91 [Hortaea werneckii]|nr:hypothetical protein KC351_g91 [Hortaea werneckii]
MRLLPTSPKDLVFARPPMRSSPKLSVTNVAARKGHWLSVAGSTKQYPSVTHMCCYQGGRSSWVPEWYCRRCADHGNGGCGPALKPRRPANWGTEVKTVSTELLLRVSGGSGPAFLQVFGILFAHDASL